jgi:hypothetical protein
MEYDSNKQLNTKKSLLLTLVQPKPFAKRRLNVINLDLNRKTEEVKLSNISTQNSSDKKHSDLWFPKTNE